LHQSGSAGIKSKVSKALQTELAPDEQCASANTAVSSFAAFAAAHGQNM
jgi:hypothetical protein